MTILISCINKLVNICTTATLGTKYRGKTISWKEITTSKENAHRTCYWTIKYLFIYDIELLTLVLSKRCQTSLMPLLCSTWAWYPVLCHQWKLSQFVENENPETCERGILVLRVSVLWHGRFRLQVCGVLSHKYHSLAVLSVWHISFLRWAWVFNLGW